MPIKPDNDAQLRAVHRSVEVTATPVPDAETVHDLTTTISQTYSTTVEDLWDAVTNPERLPRWFAPVTGDLRLGGTYQVEGNAGGQITACDPPNTFSIDWNYGETTSVVDVRITAAGQASATFSLTHRGDVADDFWNQYGPGAAGVGWDLSLLGLALHLDTGIDVPAETADWMASDDYRQFAGGASRAWADAAIAGGVPESEARGAQDRTTAFFTGAQ